MKNLIFCSVLFLIFSCAKKSKVSEDIKIDDTLNSNIASAEIGKEIFEGKGTCIACHQKDHKIIGPSLTEISKLYKQNNADMVKFLKGESEAIVDPSQYEIMKTNFSITKNMTDSELKSLEMYIHSQAK